MKHLLAILFAAILALLAIPANAQEPFAFYLDDEVAIKLTQEPCAKPELVAFLAQVPDVRAGGSAAVKFQGIDVAACWALAADGGVYVVDESGGGGVFPVAAFGGTPVNRSKPKGVSI
jgi:hypothetical protein